MSDPSSPFDPQTPFNAPPGFQPPQAPPTGPQWGPPTDPNSFTAPPPYQQQPAMPFGMPGGAKPSNHLVWAVLSTVLCCLPVGIVAIVFAAQVDSKWAMGDQAGALDASRKAKMFSWISAGVSLVFAAGYIALILLAGGFETYPTQTY